MSTNTWLDINIDNKEEADILVLGIPYDGATSLGRGTSFGPTGIRECTKHIPAVSANNIKFADLKIYDYGDVEVTLDQHKLFKDTQEMAAEMFKTGKFTLFLGGDHSVTIPLAKAFEEVYKNKKIGIIHFDAHPDLCDEYDGSKISHGCPLRRACDGNISYRDLAQVGIRSCMEEEVDLYEEHPELLLITADDVFFQGYKNTIDRLINNFEGYDAIYITLDIDSLDPAYAPGTGTPESCGLSARELKAIVNELIEKLPVVGMDLVEVSPPLDNVNNTTSWAAVKILYDVFAKVNDKLRK